MISLTGGTRAVSDDHATTNTRDYADETILGSCQVLAAFGVWAKTPGVRWFGVTVAALNGIAQLLFIPAYPFWSLTLFTVDILVIYGLVAHGKRSRA